MKSPEAKKAQWNVMVCQDKDIHDNSIKIYPV